MRLTTRSLSATLAALACLATAGPAAAQTVRSHSVRVTRSAGALPPLTYGASFADPWSSAGWGAFPAWGPWPAAGAGAWPVARAGASSGEMDRMMAEMDRDMAEMDREIDAMLGPIGWTGSGYPMAPAGYSYAGYPVAAAGAASGSSWSSHSVDDGRCVRTTTVSQTMGGAAQTTTRTEGRCD